MTLITPDELARGALLVVFGGAAGACTVAWPGSALWLLPAAVGMAGGALTVPEVRDEMRRALPGVTSEVRGMIADVRGATSKRPALAPLPQRRAASAAPRAQAEPAAATRPRPAGPRTLTPDEFAADPLFKALDADPHRFVIGHTQGGKSTAMHAMAQAWAARGEPVIVCDPDAARGQWPGCEVAGYAEDYRGIGQALERVEAAFEERSLLYADGQRDFEPMHLVIDEVHEVFENVPGARELVLDTLGRRGAKRGIRVTIGTQDQNKDTLGLDSAAVLSNFITAELQKDERGRRVATVYRGNAAKRQHVKQYALPPLPGAKTFIKAKEEPAPAPRRAAVAADAPRAEVVSVRVPERPAAPADLLASLMAELPADVAAQVPDISPERVARLARALQNVTPRPDAEITQARSVTVPSNDNGTARSSVTVGASNGGGVTVNVAQVAGGRALPKSGGLNMKARRLRTVYRKAGAEGVPFRAAYEQHGGSRNDVFKAWQDGKAGRPS